MKNSAPKQAPKHLSVEARRWWRELQSEYGINDPAGLLLLQTACEAFGEMRAHQGTVAAEGSTVEDRFGQKKPHPSIVAVRDSRAQMLAALRALNLDLEPLRGGLGRPPGR